MIEELGKSAAAEPERAIEALTLIIEGDREGWGLSLRAKDVEAILRTALASGRRAAIESATDLVHLLGAKGYRTYQQLLSAGDSGQASPEK